MLIVPAIDLYDKRVVRVEQGDLNRATVYSDSPSNVAKEFIEHGASKIHLVDLNAAVKSDLKTNEKIVDQLLNRLGSSVDFQVAGGIRDTAIAKSLYERGAKSIVIGSIAYSDSLTALGILNSLGRDRVVLALDYDGAGLVKTSGWKKTEKENVESAISRFSALGFAKFLLTSISRDGLMRGPDLEKLQTLRKDVPKDLQITASGGVSTEVDLENLRDIGIDEVIVGKAFYENSIPRSILNGIL
ncbi:MAG: 1-(5-phosphoribosyl)-5-[(5-phosphoribosylamino)methylideneamino] imidazole-4-carboxamide isomerase [Thaumarchaeota archaeon]|nr:1-(5-phosphoribosyl)-5-[(5-phosphoribosylamino)methylideneamino] imidazole-4-carboxamide isomerase [Nitrososphaerota archaeon]